MQQPVVAALGTRSFQGDELPAGSPNVSALFRFAYLPFEIAPRPLRSVRSKNDTVMLPIDVHDLWSSLL
jgi:hypothetical protein